MYALGQKLGHFKSSWSPLLPFSLSATSTKAHQEMKGGLVTWLPSHLLTAPEGDEITEGHFNAYFPAFLISLEAALCLEGEQLAWHTWTSFLFLVY
jgi:hypothetical protein